MWEVEGVVGRMMGGVVIAINAKTRQHRCLAYLLALMRGEDLEEKLVVVEPV